MREKNSISTSKGIARKLKILGKARKSIRRKFTADGKKLIQQAKNVVIGTKKNENARKVLAVTADKLAVIVKKKEGVRKNLVVKDKKLVVVAKKKESTRKKLVVVAKKKESTRKKLATVVKKHAEIAKVIKISEQKYRTLFESSGEAIMLLTADKFFDCNTATLKMFGYKSREEFLGKHPDQVSPPKQADGRDSREAADEKISTTFKRGKKSFDWIHRRADGMDFEATVLLTTMDFQGQTVLQAVVRDVTKEKDLAKAKDEFISLASHQLKSPITAISWNLEALLNGDKKPLNEGQKEIVDSAYKSARNMAELVSDFLDITKMESSGFTIGSGDVNLLETSDSVLAELANQFAEKRITLIKKYGKNIPHLNIGTKTARVIFQNLLGNAVKYTPAGGTVEAKIEKTVEGISISVKDNGYGIPNEAKSRIFTKLFRADNIKEKEPSGTGLGLYLLKSLVDKLGGKVWFESTEGQGTTFYVNLK